jgi:hypothetical protein
VATFNDTQNPVFDAGNKKPMRVRTFRAEENGKPVTRTERRPQGKYLMVIDSAGNEVPLKLHNAISEQAQFDPYGLHQKAIKTMPNTEWGTSPMIPSMGCPQATEHMHKLPEELQTGQKCVRAHDGQTIGEDNAGNIHWCKCIKGLVDQRRAKNAEIEAARDPKTTIQQAILNNSQQTTEKLVDLLDKLTKTGAIAPDAIEKPVIKK